MDSFLVFCILKSVCYFACHDVDERKSDCETVGLWDRPRDE